jgi:spermidine synthase
MITIDEVKSDYGDITIIVNKIDGCCVYWQNENCQSIADHNGVSLASYIHAIYGLIDQTGGRNVLLIGCGGGTLGTMLARAGRSVTIVDIDPLSFALARQHFYLPAEVACHVADGRVFLEDSNDEFDVIVVDAYVDDSIPQQFCEADFFELIARRLNRSGVVLFNVLVDHDFDKKADAIAGKMAKAGFEVRVLDAMGQVGRNTILACGNVANLRRPTLVIDPIVLRDDLSGELERLHFRKWRVRG